MTNFLFHIFLFTLPVISSPYKICIVGASSGLGKELIYQSTNKSDIEIIALSNSYKELEIPCRVDSFQEPSNYQKETFQDPTILRGNYWENINDLNYDHLILTTGAQPFEKDYSDELTQKFIDNLSTKCKSISLISAYGVGDSLNLYEPGISIMNAWYLKDVYRAKNNQENLLNQFNSLNDVSIKIYRPKALSYGKTLLNSISRKKLAEIILHDISKLYN